MEKLSHWLIAAIARGARVASHAIHKRRHMPRLAMEEAIENAVLEAVRGDKTKDSPDKSEKSKLKIVTGDGEE